jgi:hypothetical protein
MKRQSVIGLALLALGLGGSCLAARLETAALLSLPLLFSGTVFSTLLSVRGHISGIMAMNLLGARGRRVGVTIRCILVSKRSI